MISVIMGVYNQRNEVELERAVESILKQSISDLEFLIYDDGSDEKEATYLKKLVQKDTRIRLVRGEQNKGLAYALNQCLEQASGTYIARMDADDISEPTRLAKQKQFLEEHTEYAFVGCGAKLFDEQGVWGQRTMVQKPIANDFLPYSPYIHPSVMFRKSVLEKAGGYNTSKDTRRCEDYELFMRLYCMGYQGYNLKEYLFWYQENRTWYDKRTIRQRWAELKIRYRGFRSMGILNGKTVLYVGKPILLLFLPKRICNRIRKQYKKQK